MNKKDTDIPASLSRRMNEIMEDIATLKNEKNPERKQFLHVIEGTFEILGYYLYLERARDRYNEHEIAIQMQKNYERSKDSLEILRVVRSNSRPVALASDSTTFQKPTLSVVK